MNRLLSFLFVCLMQVSWAVASTFNLSVEVTPDGSGTLNTSGGTYEEGSTVYLRTYNHTGYVFKGWYDGETLLSSSTSFYYTMPANDILVKATYEYDPTVPGNPSMPDTTTYYSFNAVVSPNGAGSLNSINARYIAGATISLRTYNNTGYKFVGWQDEEGVTLSASTSFTYTMPNHDVTLTALYSYDPTVPANPDSMATRYTLTVASKPMGGGTFNTSSTTVEAGGNVHLYAYTNTGYEFLHWANEQGDIISAEQNFYYVMPQGNTTLYGVFDFNPTPPSNPNKNYWDKDLGELIIDDFTAGYLASAVSSAISGSNSSDVAMITVAGKMNNNDFGIANNYTNCSLLDLSRVAGVTQIPSYAFDYTNLQTVYLPTTIEKIGARAFYQCKQLAFLTVYAMTPPELDSDVFTGVPDGLVVYVPAAAIAQYQEADGWKDFTLLPIQDDIRSLTVTLPEGTNVDDYAQMWLELTNTKSGQKMHYVMTDRTSYTFANLIQNTSWSVALRTQRGDEFGRIENIDVKDEDVSVTFPSLAKPQTVTLSVVTPDGTGVTAQTQVAWTDEAGNYLSQAYSLSGLLPGTKITYSVALSQALAMQFVTPVLTEYTVSENDNDVKYELTAIQQVQLTGKVKDLTTKSALSGAVVSASQTFGGKYGKTVSSKTDANGNYALTISNVPTSLAIAATDYICQTIVCDSLLTGAATVTIPDVTLKSITGAVITLGFTYTSSVADDNEAEVQNWYNDYNNVAYTIFNKTKQHAISQFNVQYPQIVILEEVDEGDVLELTATSKTSAFIPILTTATIDAEQRASAAFNIVELGKVQASFLRNNNAAVVGSLYDSNGKLLKSYDYNNASLTISNLSDGNYTLVTMGSSKLFNTIYDLNQLPQTGLALGVDYTQNTVAVKSGVVSVISIDEVPTLDESKLYYTGDNTSFTANKSSLVSGNYLTLTGRIDFKSVYAASVSNVSLVVDLPESCSFVENSVMVGNNTGSYTLNGTRLTIPMTRYTDRVRFCVIPTLGGEYAPSAFAQFDLNGETVTQPIGSAYYTAKDLSIKVPSVIAKNTLPISGTAIGASSIEIYDGDVLIGQTKSLANGTWAITCELNEPYNLSMHSIYAKVTTKTGLELISETKECMYDVNAIQVSKVTMYHWNPEMKKTYVSEFDFLNPQTKANQWTVYYPKKVFTYTIEFTDNDPERISNVILYVHTADGQFVPVDAVFNEAKGLWYAEVDMGTSCNGYYPVNCSIDFDYEALLSVDKAMVDDAYNTGIELTTDIAQNNAAYNQFIDELNNFSATDSTLLAFVDSFDDQIGFSYTYEIDEEKLRLEMEKIQAMTPDEQAAYIDNLGSEVETEYSKIIDEQLLLQFDGVNGSTTIDVDGIEYVVTMSDASSFDETTAEENGYNKISSDEVCIYTYATESPMSFEFIDVNRNLRISLRPVSEAAVRAKAAQRNSDATEVMFEAAIEALKDASETLLKAVYLVIDFVEWAEDVAKPILAKLDENIKIAETAATNAYKSGVIAGDMTSYKDWVKKADKLKTKKANLNKWLKNVRGFKATVLTKKVDLLLKVKSLMVDVCNWLNLYLKIKGKIPCEANQQKAEQLLHDVKYNGSLVCGLDVLNLVSSCFALYAAVHAVTATPETGGVSLTIGGIAFLSLQGVSLIAGVVGDYMSDYIYKELKSEINKLRCRTDCGGTSQYPCPDDGADDDENGNSSGGTYDSGNPPDNVRIDPSGYVYEGVSANRIEGVTATIYYKEDVEDMYGDLYENIVKWDAAEYAQENPLFTDENGYYRWDVPQGLWQVKFEKEGYETTCSEWLPVPPPQLEVNIAMTQNVQPNVIAAHAYNEAVEVEFDKYMMPELLNTENIFVMADGKNVEGSIELLDEEVSYEGETETFASKVRFNAISPFDASEVTLFVNNRVKSYAGIRMQDNYQQTFAVEQEVKSILCASLITVGYGNTETRTISVLPAAASKGKTLRIKSSSSTILSVSTDSVIIGDNGKAEFILSGELPGTAALTFSVEGTDKSATSMVTVKQIGTVATPTSNIASGTKVEKGAEIVLSCATEGATIYYTTDGSCPCDEASSRKVYDGTPIVVNDSVTIKAMAIAPDMYESDVAEFTYTVDIPAGLGNVLINDRVQIYPLPIRDKLNIVVKGEVINNVTLLSMNGLNVYSKDVSSEIVTLDVDRLLPGVYIIVIHTSESSYTREVVKIN